MIDSRKGARVELKLASVMIVSYRNLHGVYSTLDSIFRQDYPEIELVFADDASPDYHEKQPEIAEYVQSHKGENIREVLWVCHQENVGTVRNENDAIRASHGEYLFSIAPEDELAHEKALSNLIRTLEETGRDICFGRLKGVTPDGKTVDHLLSCESDYDLLKSYTVEQTRNRLFSRNFLPAPSAIKTRKLFEQHGLYSESVRLIEDYPYWLTLTKDGVPFAYLDEVSVLYRLSGVSSSGHYSEAFMKDMLRIYDLFIFPYDHRFGVLQGVYNLLKKQGLSFYMAKAGWDRTSTAKRIWLRIRFLPFFLYTGYLDWKVAKKNQSLANKRKGASE